eukprot:TRINITY_DN146_c0_g1_i12.p1 TRINITY_DN146_c0_g1~~TRINITY_DN146_c0_g1_i12.p1  ORF type:complete len:436 (+),score=154.93 TRINITY_DN146_c0_g1_i12:129-1436(+)
MSMSLFDSPGDTWSTFEKSGLAKCHLRWYKTFFLGVLGGVFVGFGGCVAISVGWGIPYLAANGMVGLQKFIFGATFPIGLVLIVMTGAELVTGNMMTLVGALMSFHNKHVLKGLFKSWFCSFFGNMAGAILMAYFMGYLTDIFADSFYQDKIRSVAEFKTSFDAGKLFLRGIGCNMMVCLSVFMGYSSKDVCGRSFVMWFGIMTFAACGFEHTVANMFFIPLGLFMGAKSDWGLFFYHNIIPVTCGNIVGGGLFVGGLFFFFYGHFQPWQTPVAQAVSSGEAPRPEVEHGADIEMGDMIPIQYMKRYVRKDGSTVKAIISGHVTQVPGKPGKLTARIKMVNEAGPGPAEKSSLLNNDHLERREGVVVADLDESGHVDHFDFVDDYVSQMLGYTREELMAQKMDALSHPDDRHALERALKSREDKKPLREEKHSSV